MPQQHELSWHVLNVITIRMLLKCLTYLNCGWKIASKTSTMHGGSQQVMRYRGWHTNWWTFNIRRLRWNSVGDFRRLMHENKLTWWVTGDDWAGPPVRVKGGQGDCHTLWRHHNGHDGISNHQPHHCLLNRLFGRRSKKTSKVYVTGLCAGNSPGTGEFPAQITSNPKNVSIWWRHHAVVGILAIITRFGN